ncbi:DUF2569 domain-containing protein [Rosenbergiella collisarenosi]|uniref:DUF2569 domain-containing protein n=1 Tax=Rosenbergiella collisarenosi TaxID=1544695 RepID=UPI001F4D6FC2|nr:DUF2569 domain-containing protein [Rosenbergiella collisarenosi]
MECIKCQSEHANQESGLCQTCEDKQYRKIDGLLYLPAIGLVLTISNSVLDIRGLVVNFSGYLTESGALFHFILVTLLLTLISLSVSLYAAWMFFRKKRQTRRAMISYYITGLIIALFTVIYPAMFFGMPMTSASMSLLIRGIIGVLVWIPYFIVSKRINVVFCR